MLNIAGNNLDSIRDVECLRNLYQLHANDNLLTDMKELAHVVGGMFRLWRLDLMGNPLCHKAKYRDRVIVMAKNLGKKLQMVKFFYRCIKEGVKELDFLPSFFRQIFNSCSLQAFCYISFYIVLKRAFTCVLYWNSSPFIFRCARWQRNQ